MNSKTPPIIGQLAIVRADNFYLPMVVFTSPDATTLCQHSTTSSVAALNSAGGIPCLHAVTH